MDGTTPLSLGAVATSRKPDERRLPIYPEQLGQVDARLRARIVLERGYGRSFGIDDAELARLVGGLRSREEILGACDIVVLPEPCSRTSTRWHRGPSCGAGRIACRTRR
jgi:hypothetical protein